jgi:hypothetical protein
MRSLLISTLLASLATFAGPADAQTAGRVARPPCHDYGEIARQLADRYKEAPVSAGLQANGHLLQVFRSPESGTWTILSTAPGGLTCIVAAGRGWETIEPPSSDPSA